MNSRKHLQQLTACFLILFTCVVCADENIVQTVSNPQQLTADVTLDTRPLASCKQSTLAGAICLPIEDFIAPQHRLANWSGILWLLGTAGLTGGEHIAVIGEHSQRRHVLAGLLAIAGQKKVSIVEMPVSELLRNTNNVSSGKQRSNTRTEVFTTPMRSELLVLRDELAVLIEDNNVLLDGRPESEYYGVTIRAQRGGHVPGAIHSPISTWQNAGQQPLETAALPVSYANDPVAGLAYFSALLSKGQVSRLYLAGWSEYAADGASPIDSASYPATNEQLSETDSKQPLNAASDISMPLNSQTAGIAAVASVCLVSFGFLAGRVSKANSTARQT